MNTNFFFVDDVYNNYRCELQPYKNTNVNIEIWMIETIILS